MGELLVPWEPPRLGVLTANNLISIECDIRQIDRIFKSESVVI